MCVRVPLFAAWGALKALWEVWHKEKKGTKKGGYFCFQRDAKSELHVKPLRPCVSCLMAREAAWQRSERSRRSWSCTYNTASSSYNLSVIWNMTDVCVCALLNRSYMIVFMPWHHGKICHICLCILPYMTNHNFSLSLLAFNNLATTLTVNKFNKR